MPTHLNKILAHTMLGVAERKAMADLTSLERKAADHAPRGFAAALHKAAKSGPAVIAELKKASPSKGVIRAEFYPAELAKTLESAGAAALSVLTDEAFFQGSLENLQIASDAVKIPCLRKDFIVDPFQILEARAFCADAILLIVAALTDQELMTLRQSAREMQLDVLCEVHNREELQRAIQLDCELVGVNSRDLRTFAVRPETQLELVQTIPGNVVRVAESGIRTAEDINRLVDAGYDAFLIGEALMRQPDPAAALTLLLDHEYSIKI